MPPIPAVEVLGRYGGRSGEGERQIESSNAISGEYD